MNNIVILLPGTTGSSLVPAGGSDVVWPTQVEDELKNLNTEKAYTELMATNLIPKEPLGWDTSSDPKPSGYGVFVSYFITNNHSTAILPTYSSDQVTDPKLDLSGTLASDLLVGFAYDWRVDNSVSAQALGSVIDQVKTAYKDVPYQIYLVGHSMGGLVARIYLENLADDVSNIKSLITLGTPHYGAPLALCAIRGKALSKYLSTQTSESLLERLASYKVFDDFAQMVVTTPADPGTNDGPNGVSSFELLPPDSREFIVYTEGTPITSYSIFDYNNIDGKDADLPTDLFDELNNLSLVNLNDAQSFWNSLADTEKLTYYCIYGRGIHPTCIGFDYSQAKGLVDVESQSVELNKNTNAIADGDGIVPILSACYNYSPQDTAHTAGFISTHDALPTNPDVLQQISNWMKEE